MFDKDSLLKKRTIPRDFVRFWSHGLVFCVVLCLMLFNSNVNSYKFDFLIQVLIPFVFIFLLTGWLSCHFFHNDLMEMENEGKVESRLIFNLYNKASSQGWAIGFYFVVFGGLLYFFSILPNNYEDTGDFVNDCWLLSVEFGALIGYRYYQSYYDYTYNQFENAITKDNTYFLKTFAQVVVFISLIELIQYLF